MAFQPIANLQNETVYAYEALVRGQDGSGAGAILAQVSDDNRYAFDQRCRTTAIELAARLNLASSGANLSINFLPNAVYEPRACIRATLASALRTGFPLEQIIFEFTEGEALDTDHILQILRSYRDMGFKTAIDDFGSGFAGLGLLSKFQPDIVKIDMQLIRGIDTDQTKRTIIKHTISMMHDLDIQVICEGVETVSEHDALRDLGVTLMQGYLFAKPVIEELPSVSWVRPMLDPAQVA
ncbi:MAG: EAL domain-containing protein [Beijerinckiaceae bacterium]|nr:EAL domain-containing protein [Beijerinckiaceae bacterium]